MTLTVPDCEGCKFWKNEVSVREKYYKELDAEQWAMWINTRNMRQFLDGFNEALERINTALDAIDFRFIRIEEALNLKPDTFFDRKPNNNFNKPRVNLYE
mgnify:CR=1 FL=1|tara:strand:- start:166 stop:465 length:300 start_codon:yes stop_codon:yes gene_type:complete